MTIAKKNLLPLFFAILFFASFPHHARAQMLFSDGTLLRATGDARVYAVFGNHKRAIADETVFNSYGWRMTDVHEVAPEVVSVIPDTRVVKTIDAPTFFDITSGKRVTIPSVNDFLTRGFTYDEVAIVNQADLESYPLEVIATENPALPAPPSKEPVIDEQSEILMQKITEARALLRAAPLLYPQEKRIAKYHTISSGQSGSDVLRVQQTLQKLGYFPAKTETNAVFGPTTVRSVKAFQKAQGITQNGVVGPQTFAALMKKGLGLPVAGSVVKVWHEPVPHNRDVLLAVWNKESNRLKTVAITLESHTKKIGKKTSTSYAVTTHTPGFTITYKGGNGVNVQYAVTSPIGYRVLANRFPLFDESPGKVGTFPPHEDVYVPYNDAFRTVAIVAAGRDYLDHAADEALATLHSRGVQSVSGAGLVGDLTSADELKNIAIIEHTDTTEFLKLGNKQAIIDKVFTIIATNREDAFRYSGSTKGALGLAQFLSKTYALTRARYPSAGLIPDFEDGMSNHVNAFMAMALYHDSTNAALENYVREQIAGTPDELTIVMTEVRAAAYNGGASRVKTAIKKFGADWAVASSKKYGLRAETRSYIEKLKTVQHLMGLL